MPPNLALEGLGRINLERFKHFSAFLTFFTILAGTTVSVRKVVKVRPKMMAHPYK